MQHLPAPPFLIHVMWHPDCLPAARMANGIRDHFGTHRFRNVAGGVGIDVVFQTTLGSSTLDSLPMTWRAGCPIAVVAMIDQSFAKDPEWVGYLRELGQRAANEAAPSHLIPVVLEPDILNGLQLNEQAICWYDWDATAESPEERLNRELAYEFARMLRRQLHALRRPHGEAPPLEQYLEKIQTFVSYSRNDEHGKEIAEEIRGWLYQNSALASFLDVYDIPAGLPFHEVIEHHIGRSVFLAIQTDSYSSREWCRREVIVAKRRGVPMIVVDCLNAGEERAFPYLGNVPVVRMDPVEKDRLPEIAGRLLDEVLADFLWRCRVKLLPDRWPDIVFMSRPPELISLATLGTREEERRVVVYPDPPLDQEEQRVLRATRSDLQLRTMTQWLAEEPS